MFSMDVQDSNPPLSQVLNYQNTNSDCPPLQYVTKDKSDELLKGPS